MKFSLAVLHQLVYTDQHQTIARKRMRRSGRAFLQDQKTGKSIVLFTHPHGLFTPYLSAFQLGTKEKLTCARSLALS